MTFVYLYSGYESTTLARCAAEPFRRTTTKADRFRHARPTLDPGSRDATRPPCHTSLPAR